MAVPVVALAGTFAAYEIQPQPAPASSAAAYHRHAHLPEGVVADGSGSAMATVRPTASNTTPRAAPSRHPVKAASTRRPRPAKAPSPAASPSKTPSTSPGGGSANLKAAVQKDIADGNYLLAVGQFLVENGYSDAAAAGVASCIDGESGGNPESVGSGGGGLIGWTPISSAAPNPNIITGNAAQDMMTQLTDILYYNSTEIGQALVTQLDGISDPVAAADFFSQNFERPAVTDSDVVPAVAEQIFSDLRG